MLNILRSLLFYVGYALTLVVFSSLGVLLSPLLPRRHVQAICATWCHIAIVWARICCGIRYDISGLENVPDGACVVLAKHESAWETLLVQWLFFPAVTVLKRELLRIPFFGWALRLFDPIAINRDERSDALKVVLRQGSEKLKAGRRVVIFPEGTRALPGQPLPYSVGGAMLAVRAGVPVLPMALTSGDCWPRGTLIKTPGVIRVVIGAPVSTEGKNAKTLNAEVRDWIESRMTELRQPQGTPE
ncbi:MAG: lysophospholipid acyltransferase family protein [Moraxellaceae bacterium]|nr:lysophospholipid acyltransferase family protein [Moraxellaceae bacterium]